MFCSAPDRTDFQNEKQAAMAYYGKNGPPKIGFPGTINKAPPELILQQNMDPSEKFGPPLRLRDKIM